MSNIRIESYGPEPEPVGVLLGFLLSLALIPVLFVGGVAAFPEEPNDGRH